MKIFATLFLVVVVGLSSAWGQTAFNFWRDVEEQSIQQALSKKREMSPAYYRTLALDINRMRATLRNAPVETSPGSRNGNFNIVLPMPDGTAETFSIVESSVMMPGLAAKYPQIKSYKGYSANNTGSTVRLDISENGFHAVMHTLQGDVYIDPYVLGQEEFYYAYFWKDCANVLEANPTLACGSDLLEENILQSNEDEPTSSEPAVGSRSNVQRDLRTYRLAVATTGEFTNVFGGTKPQAISTINTAVNRLNEIYEREVAIRLILVDNNDTIVFVGPNTDPYTNANVGGSLLGQNGSVVNARVGINSYDIGHVFTGSCTDVGGIASLASVCTGGKANGVTCFYTSSVEAITTRVFAHEVGHQFGASHTMSNCGGDGENVSPETGYEPGSGSTIMSYAGSCGDQNVQFNSDAYFHVHSLQQMTSFSRIGTGNICATVVPTGNNEPELELPYESGFYIPISTPFQLTATASDVDGDNLTYCWEQYDIGPFIPDLGSPTGEAPSFRSFPPVTTPTRVFPRLPVIIANTSEEVEVLPTYSRILTFRCTVRDNAPEAGAAVWKEVRFRSTAGAGPFLVQSPNADSVVWEVGSYQEIVWDVANTDKAPVNCKFVNLKLSLDGGNTYPITLLSNTPNDGSEFITVPRTLTNRARVRVEAADNIFFDISNQNFNIIEPQQPGFSLTMTPAFQQICLPTDVNIELQADSLLGLDSIIILSVVDGLPEGAVATFSKDTITTTGTSRLMIDFSEATYDGLVEVFVQALVPGVDTMVQKLSFSLVYNNFSALELLSPVNTQAGFFGTSDFTWNDIPNANSYDFQLATSPAFGETIIFERTGLQDTLIRPNVFLDTPNTVYFWRVRPINECGAGAFTPPFVFQTINAQCNPHINNTEIVIPASGTPTVESKIFVSSSGTITDLNIRNITARYQPISYLRLSLISPAGTEAILFDNQCASTQDFNVGFDDEAPSTIACPPTSGIVYKPLNPLSIFDGENTQGDWTLQAKVTRVGFGSAGRLNSWQLEFCADVIATAPTVITNDTFPIPPGARSQITKDFLEVQDGEFGPNDLIYTLTTVPRNGTLFARNLALTVGSTFRQSDINAFEFSYQHDGSATVADDFRFIVQDPQGGLLGTPKFNIVISEGATVNTTNLEVSNNIRLLPNPTNGQVQILLEDAIQGDVQLSLYDLQGRELLRQSQNGTNNSLHVDATNLPNGIYLLSLRTEKRIYTERLVVQH